MNVRSCCRVWSTGIGLVVLVLAGCQKAELIRLVDKTPPEMNLVGDPVLNVSVNDIYNDPGATATDDVDGDLTPYIDCDNPVDASVIGSYVVTYNVCDFSGNDANEINRLVHVLDPNAPVITLIGESPVYVKANTVYIDYGATAQDGVDGNITSLITVDNPVDTTIPGTYTVTYSVIDSSGNPALEMTRTVIVDGEVPVITLLGSPDLVLEQFYQYTDAGASATDDIDGDITIQIVVDNPIRSGSEVGTHRITYNVSDRAGNSAAEVVRTVQIIDVSPPSLTVAPTAVTYVGDSFTPPAATANDNTNGDISHLITIDGTVNTNLPGEYKLLYSVSDTFGNTATATCRVNVIVFSSYYGRNSGRSDYAKDVIENPDGGFVIIGDSASDGVGYYDIWIVAVDEAGAKTWESVYSTSPHDYGRAVANTPDDTILALGYNGQYDDVWLVELASDGTEIAADRYSADGKPTNPTDMAVTDSGEIFITGSWTPDGETYSQALLMKIGSTGTLEWSQAYGGADVETAEAILELGNGDFVLAGSTYSTTTYERDYIVWKVDSTGVLLWERSFGGTGDETAVSIAETTDGNIVICGSTDSYGAGGTDAWILELDSNGNLNWSATVGLSMNETANDILPVPGSGTAFIGTRSRSMSAGEDELWYVELDNTGTVVLEREIGGRMDDESGESLIFTSDGFRLATGRIDRFAPGAYSDYWIIKF